LQFFKYSCQEFLVARRVPILGAAPFHFAGAENRKEIIYLAPFSLRFDTTIYYTLFHSPWQIGIEKLEKPGNSHLSMKRYNNPPLHRHHLTFNGKKRTDVSLLSY
jgi:hypothetical protein